MRAYDLIQKKRDGGTLTPEEIRFFIEGYTKGTIPDYQASAFTMAVFFQGMTSEETAAMTMAMADSGDRLSVPGVIGPTVDKHSTGGVGDKTSLVVAPIVASCGITIAKMSGRGLGHTGGTTDKLSAIPGFRVDLSASEIANAVKESGLCITGSSAELAPADKKLYALRDVTATVDSIPLIAASIMSKKIAAGSKNIVLDVKTGSGAFMKKVEDSIRLAKEMVQIGAKQNLKVTAVISNMDVPLGNAVGNSLEVIEAIQTLRNNGPEDFKELCLELSTQMLMLCDKGTKAECQQMAEDALRSGNALRKFKEMVSAQGGDVLAVDDIDRMPKAMFSRTISADKVGYIHHMDAEKVGISAMLLGAGRKTKDDIIDLSAGILLHKKTGCKVQAGDSIAVLYTNNESLLDSAEQEFLRAVKITNEEPQKLPMIFEIITNQ